MFEDKRFNNEINSNSVEPTNNYGIHDNLGNGNIQFNEIKYVPEPNPINRKKEKKNNNLFKYILISLISIILIVLIFTILINVLKSPKKVYEEALSYSYQYLKTYIESIENKSLKYDLEEDTISFTGNLKLDTNISDVKDINKYNLDYNLGLDIKKEKIETLLNLKENNKSIIDLNLYILNKNLLLKSNKIYDKLILLSEEIDLDFSKLNTNFSTDNLLDMLTFLNAFISDNLDKEKITKENITISINNINKKVTSNNYYLNETELKNTYEKLINEIINDDGALRAISNILGLTRKETKDYLTDLKNNEEILNNLKELEFKIYTEGLANNFVGISIYYNNFEILKLTKKVIY